MATVTTFLLKAIAISLSGVMAPGPMTVATMVAGTRRRHAGVWIALGHAVIEIPLIIVIVAGAAVLLRSDGFRAGIGVAGGGFLLLFGAQLLMSLDDVVSRSDAPADRRHPFWTGVVLSGGNPYFLLWWATIGLTLIAGAADLGVTAFALFALVHWLCDLVWLEALSLASFKGSSLLAGRGQKIVLGICSAVLIGFGCLFLYDAGGLLIRIAAGG